MKSFVLNFSKKIIDAKIHNQIVVLRRYARNSRENIDRPVAEMKYMQQKVVEMAKSVDQLMGLWREMRSEDLFHNVRKIN